MVTRMLQTHTLLRMREETLFLAIYVMDKYLSLKPIRSKELDLFLVAVLFMAAKYEETTYVRMFRIIGAYSGFRFEPCQVIRMEADILDTLEFKLNIICPYDFLKRLFLIHKIEDKNVSGLNSRVLQFHVGGQSVPGYLPPVHQLRAGPGRLRDRPEDDADGAQPRPKRQVHPNGLRAGGQREQTGPEFH